MTVGSSLCSKLGACTAPENEVSSEAKKSWSNVWYHGCLNSGYKLPLRASSIHIGEYDKPIMTNANAKSKK
jgi:hypothetical protein